MGNKICMLAEMFFLLFQLSPQEINLLEGRIYAKTHLLRVRWISLKLVTDNQSRSEILVYCDVIHVKEVFVLNLCQICQLWAHLLYIIE